MNRERAKQILLHHRPGLDEADAEVSAALELVQRDEELRRWFEAQQAAHAVVRKQLRSVTPPAGLKEQILSERPWHTQPVTVRHLVAVAAAVIVVTWFGFWWSNRPPYEDKSFAAYRARMVSTAQRAYIMDLTTNDLGRIRTFLRERGAPGDFTPPAGLQPAIGLGCVAMNWQTHSVAMICYKTGQPLPPGQISDLWLFVIEEKGVPDAPKLVTPEFVKLDSVATASWTRDGKTYVLAVQGSEELLRKFL